MRRILPLRADRPLLHAADDLLGFDRIAEGLAAQVLATRDGGLLAAARAPLGGAGRSSFLNLLHEALLSRGLPVLRLRGGFDARVLRDVTPLHQGAPLILVDDADPAACRDWSTEAIILVAWSLEGGDEGAALAPLTVDLPAWDEPAAADLARRLARESGATEAREANDVELAWRALLLRATTPRHAWRLVQTAAAAMATCSASDVDVLAAIAGRSSEALRRDVRPFLFGAGALPSESVIAPAAETLAPSADSPADDETEAARARCGELSQQADSEAADELEGLLSDERAAVRLAAIQAFAHLPAPLALAHVRPLLTHPDASSRRAAAHVLGRLGDQASFDAIAALVADPSADVRRSATAALGRLGGARAITVLLPALDDPNAGLRMAAETALCQLLDEVGADAASAGAEDRPLRELIAALAMILPSRHDTARNGALTALERLGLGTAAEALAALLRGGDEREREAATSALLRVPGSVDAVVPLLDEPDEDIARRAADLLGRLGDTRAVPALLDAHARATASVRQAAAASLVRLGFGG